MNFFDEIVDKQKGSKKKGTKSWENLKGVATFRPTIYIGIGGFGTSVVRKIKESIEGLIPDDNIKREFSYIAIDTHPRGVGGKGFSAKEYLPLNIDSPAGRIAKDPDNTETLSWFREISQGWPGPRSITSGSNKVKAAGRFAFQFYADRYYSMLNSAYNKVIGADTSGDTTPKIYLISSLAGGTGAGMLLDVMFITSQYLNDNEGSEYMLQVFCVTPDALESTVRSFDMPDLYTNTYATLKEAFHFFTNNTEFIPYNITAPNLKKLKANIDLRPDNFYLITNKNNEGRIVFDEMPHIGDMIANFLLFEIQSPLVADDGAPKIHDNENTDFVSPGQGNMPRFLSSLGVVTLGYPKELLEKLFSLNLIHILISREIETESMQISSGEQWIEKNALSEAGSDMLQQKIRLDTDGNVIRISIDIHGMTGDIERTLLKKQCESLKKQMITAIKDQKKGLIDTQQRTISDNAITALHTDVREISNGKSLGEAYTFISKVREAIKVHNNALTEELNVAKNAMGKISEDVVESIGRVSLSASSGFFGRKDRIRIALDTYGANLELYLNQQLVVWSQEAALKIYASLMEGIDKIWSEVEPSYTALQSRDAILENEMSVIAIQLSNMADFHEKGGHRRSLLNFIQSKEFFDELYDEKTIEAVLMRVREKCIGAGDILNNYKASDSDWAESVLTIVGVDVSEKLGQYSIKDIMEKFYPTKKSKDMLFKQLFAHGSPLFPTLDAVAERDCPTSHILAAHPSVRDYIKDLVVRRKLPDSAVLDAYFPSNNEIILYTIQQGLTAHSLTQMGKYKAYYNDKIESADELLKERRAVKPIHSWLGAENWEDIIPKEPSEEDSYKWFILGRAFSHLFPTAVTSAGTPHEKNNKAYIYKRGSYYYIQNDNKTGEIKLGNSLEKSLEAFESKPELRKQIESEVMKIVDTEGSEAIQRRLTYSDDQPDEYIVPVLSEEIKSARKSRDFRRVRILEKLKILIDDFVNNELNR